MNILLAMSGSIACEKATGLIDIWQSRGDTVRVILTTSAKNFITENKIKLQVDAVYSDTFAPGAQMAHIELGHWAEQIVIAPATANLINKLAAGIADDMLTTSLLAAYRLHKPSFIVPAMNSRMLAHPATQESLHKLRNWGYKIVPTGIGELACGEVGPGRLAELEDIIAGIDVNAVHAAGSGDKGAILITLGGVREAIDSVRYIGNSSSGATGSQLADYFVRAGYSVTALCARHGVKPQDAKCIEYLDFEDLSRLLQSQLAAHEFNAVIHAAAVSDYSVSHLLDDAGEVRTQSGKLNSASGLHIVLKRNPKLLTKLRGWSKNPGAKIIGFKLTDTDKPVEQQAAIMRLLQQDEVDAVVHNDLAEISKHQHSFHFYSSATTKQDYIGAAELAAGLENYLEKGL